MCGIAAILGHFRNQGLAELRIMNAAMRHRGPDAEGFWCDGPVGLGHVRLSILELSPAGAQPMTSRDGRWTITFNGEIYNHLDLRNELSGPWRGHSDTETLIEGLAAWGFDGILRRCVGMFAVAAWDAQERCLWLARDRMGEKPLYFGVVEGQLRAASELKALLAGIERPDVDRDSLTLFLRHGYIPAPYTIWKGIRKLLPGHVMCVPESHRGCLPESRPYWSVADLIHQPAYAGDDVSAVDHLDGLLRQVIAGQMSADVPLGAFLSGGVDSSAVVAVMQAQSRQRIRTFTIGFDERDYDESLYAEAVARHLGTDHTTLRVTAADALAVIGDLPKIWDEPFADSSQIPTLLLSRLTRKHVTVSLSGDAGDELFAGYNRYTLLGRLRRFQMRFPRQLRHVLAAAMRAVPPVVYDVCARPIPGLRRVGDKAHKLAGVLGATSVDQLYQQLVSHWDDPARVVIGGAEPPTALTDGRASSLADPLSRIQFLDQLSYLPDDILVKVDRAAMSASLETRVPFLDHRLVSFAWSLPIALKVRNGQGKWILRQVLDRYVPRSLIDRPKMGFGIPLDGWLRGPLRAWAENLLSEERLRREDFFHPEPIRRKWLEHLSGRRNWQYQLWNILMFQTWRQSYLSP